MRHCCRIALTGALSAARSDAAFTKLFLQSPAGLEQFWDLLNQLLSTAHGFSDSPGFHDFARQVREGVLAAMAAVVELIPSSPALCGSPHFFKALDGVVTFVLTSSSSVRRVERPLRPCVCCSFFLSPLSLCLCPCVRMIQWKRSMRLKLLQSLQGVVRSVGALDASHLPTFQHVVSLCEQFLRDCQQPASSPTYAPFALTERCAGSRGGCALPN